MQSRGQSSGTAPPSEPTLECERQPSASSSSDYSDSSDASEAASDADWPSQEAQPSLQARLAAFLPRLAAANKELEELKSRGQIDSARLDNVADDEERYIEMDLGLGVLEEQRNGDSDSDSDDSSDSSGRNGVGDSGTDSDADGKQKSKAKETNRLAKLMGKPPSQIKAGIQEMDQDVRGPKTSPGL